MQVQMSKYVRSFENENDVNHFAMHLILINSAIANWRPYLAYLTKATNEGVTFISTALPIFTDPASSQIV